MDLYILIKHILIEGQLSSTGKLGLEGRKCAQASLRAPAFSGGSINIERVEKRTSGRCYLAEVLVLA